MFFWCDSSVCERESVSMISVLHRKITNFFVSCVLKKVKGRGGVFVDMPEACPYNLGGVGHGGGGV